jgi:hypothetical protein
MEKTEKAVIIVVDGALVSRKVTKGTFASLDALALRGQCGYVSTFTTCPDTITQLVGSCYFSPEQLAEGLGPMQLAVLKDKSTYSAFGDLTPIAGLSIPQIYDLIQQKLTACSVIIVEIGAIADADQLVGRVLPQIDPANVAVCGLFGYGPDGQPPVFPCAPVVDPSWKVIGPNVVEALSVEKPLLFVSASLRLTRTDKVKAFDEEDVRTNASMGVLPICQLLREFSYYTGSSWKYGA